MAADVIDGIRLIRHNAVRIEKTRDATAYPYLLTASLRAPRLMEFAFVCIVGGTEEIAVEGKTREALEEFIARNDLRKHPRLLRLEIADTRRNKEKPDARW